MENVNRPEIIDELAEKFNIPKRKLNRILDAYEEIIMNNVAEGKTVKITGFAAFSQFTKAARDIVDPRTGITHHFPERKAVKIRPLLKFVNIFKESGGEKC